MKDQETKNKFIELRAQCLSFDKIAQQLNVSKKSLITWSKELSMEISNLKVIELESLQEKYLMTQKMRIDLYGTKLNNCNLIRVFKKTVRKAGISDFTWHGLRRTFATRLAHKGLDIYKISRLLGHEDVQTTQKRYAHHCTESLRIGVEILDADYVLTTFGEKEGFLGTSNLS